MDISVRKINLSQQSNKGRMATTIAQSNSMIVDSFMESAKAHKKGIKHFEYEVVKVTEHEEEYEEWEEWGEEEEEHWGDPDEDTEEKSVPTISSVLPEDTKQRKCQKSESRCLRSQPKPQPQSQVHHPSFAFQPQSQPQQYPQPPFAFQSYPMQQLPVLDSAKLQILQSFYTCGYMTGVSAGRHGA